MRRRNRQIEFQIFLRLLEKAISLWWFCYFRSVDILFCSYDSCTECVCLKCSVGLSDGRLVGMYVWAELRPMCASFTAICLYLIEFIEPIRMRFDRLKFNETTKCIGRASKRADGPASERAGRQAGTYCLAATDTLAAQ